MDQDEGPSTQRGNKNKKDRCRPDNTALVTVTNHMGKPLDSPCTNHAYPIKHLYKDYELLKRFL